MAFAAKVKAIRLPAMSRNVSKSGSAVYEELRRDDRKIR
jgi:hypothetical protein